MDTTRPELLSRFRRYLLGRVSDQSLPADVERAATEFCEFYDPILRRFLHRLAPRALAEEIYSATWTGICEQLPRFKYDPKKGRFRSWLFAVARNVTVDELSRRARQIQAEINNQSGGFWQAVIDFSTSEPSKDIEQQWHTDVAQSITAAFRGAAPEQELRTFELHFVDGYTPTEIAAAMEITPAAARQNLKRVKKRLASIAKRLLGPEEA